MVEVGAPSNLLHDELGRLSIVRSTTSHADIAEFVYLYNVDSLLLLISGAMAVYR